MVGTFSFLATCALIANALALPQGSAGWSATGDPVGPDMGFNISFWESSNCHEKTKSVQEVYLDSTLLAVEGDIAIASYKISRDMDLKDRLEFRNADGGLECSKRLEITSPDSNGHPLVKDKCYKFSNGRTAEVISFSRLVPIDYG